MENSVIQHIFNSYHQQCTLGQQVPSSMGLLNFMLKKGLIDKVALRHFLILEEYEKLSLANQKMNKSEVVQMLAHSFSMHPSSIWLILKTNRNENKT